MFRSALKILMCVGLRWEQGSGNFICERSVGVYRACSSMNIMDPVLSELLSRFGVDSDSGRQVLSALRDGLRE